MSDGNEYRKFLLAELVQAYMPLDDPAAQDFNELLKAEQNREVQVKTQTWFEEGLEKGHVRGHEEGREEGLRLLIVSWLEDSWGPLEEGQHRRVMEMSDEEVRAARVAFKKSDTLDEFMQSLEGS